MPANRHVASYHTRSLHNSIHLKNEQLAGCCLLGPFMSFLTRRRVFPTLLAGLAVGGTTHSPPRRQEDWQAFERRFVLPEGRVVDNGNRNISHSEG